MSDNELKLSKVIMHYNDGTAAQLVGESARLWMTRLTDAVAASPAIFATEPKIVWQPHHPRERLPMTRSGRTGKFCFKAGTEDEVRGYVYANAYPDKRLGEVFIVFDRAGTTLRGLADGFATSMSVRLQRGETCVEVTDKLIGMKFEPAGATGNVLVPRATSVLDFIARWLRHWFVETPIDEPLAASSER